jgi:methyltransferase family protein
MKFCDTAECNSALQVKRMERVVQPELLDGLPAGDPRALHSRRDIVRLNALMGHSALMADELKIAFARHLSFRIVDLGAGGGEFMLSVARRLRQAWRGVEVTLVDREDVVRSQTREQFFGLEWKVRMDQADALQWLRNGAAQRVEAIVTNLFLHQLPDAQLSELLSRAAVKARLFIALEPRRSKRALFLSRCLWLLGCNSVTRHDAPVSVRAGFAGRELSALWPDRENWELTERPAGWFSHLFIARRKEIPDAGIFQPIASAVFDRSTTPKPVPAEFRTARDTKDSSARPDDLRESR